MRQLSIPIETPATFCDISFERLAQDYGAPVDIVTDLEGTAVAWGIRAEDARLGEDVTDTLIEATHDRIVVGAHAITNRGGRGGAVLTAMFVDTVDRYAPRLDCFVAYPHQRSERKPSGVLGGRVAAAITRHRQRSEVVIAFVGDKFSDMAEANTIHERTKIPVVGFMVERYGATDHPMDTLFGKRRQATAAREALKPLALNRYVR